MPYKIPADSVLLLEGGAMRGVYTSGVLDVLREMGLYDDLVETIESAVEGGMADAAVSAAAAIIRFQDCFIVVPRYTQPVTGKLLLLYPLTLFLSNPAAATPSQAAGLFFSENPENAVIRIRHDEQKRETFFVYFI